ncbi:hypothetical protein [Erythrobacter sp. EC-HK427]|nr:hypothetical protein [Erythrobacter sp. EC-HK427]VVT04925.1 hypothetical protein ERY430_41166 [Erythrobacter sp. EC-HK427]
MILRKFAMSMKRLVLSLSISGKSGQSGDALIRQSPYLHEMMAGFER